MIGFWIFMLLMELLLPFTMIGVGFYFIKNPPKEINSTFGYRTTRSMKNKDTWNFAHHYCGKLWKIIGIIVAPITFIAMLFSFGKDIDYVGYYGMVIMGVQLVALIGPIFSVESALKRTFDTKGNRRL